MKFTPKRCEGKGDLEVPESKLTLTDLRKIISQLFCFSGHFPESNKSFP
jgi:hypothetical protein